MTDYTLTSDVGTFTYTGQDAYIYPGYAVFSGVGSYAYTGQTIAFPRTYVIHPEVGTFGYTGIDLDFDKIPYFNRLLLRFLKAQSTEFGTVEETNKIRWWRR